MSGSDQQPNSQPTDSVSKADLDAAIERARNFEAKLTDYEKKFKGVDIEALRAKAEERDLLIAEAANRDPKKFETELEKRVSELRKNLQKELEDKDALTSKLISENKELKVVNKVFGDHASKFVDTAHSQLKREIRDNLDVDEDGNIFIKGENGKPLYSKTKPAQLMTVDEYVNELIELYPHMAKNPNLSGGKKDTEKMGAVGANTLPAGFDTWSQKERTEYFRKNPEAMKAALG